MRHKLVEQIATCIEREQLAQSGQTIYVAVSGGADSIALLTALYLLNCYNLTVIHCNFSLRGEDSNGDEVFVQEYAHRLQLPFFSKSYDTEGYAQKNKISIEMAARELRYNWFYDILAKEPNVRVALAHNMNDSVETLLYNLAQGTGIRGLIGIPYKRNSNGIIRPMLDVSKDDVLDFFGSNPIIKTWREDKSNMDTRYRRNYIRHKLLPSFEGLKQNAIQQMALSIQQMRGVEAFYRSAIEMFKDKVFKKNQIHIPLLLQTPSPSTLLFEILSQYNFTSAQCYEISSKIKTISSGATFLSESHKLVRSWDYLELIEVPQGEDEAQSIEINILNLPRTVQLSNGGKICIYPTSLIEVNNPLVLILRKDMLYGKTILYRSPRNGDKIKPFGMIGKKLISKVLIDKKVLHSKRMQSKIIELGGEVLWLIGYCKSELTRIDVGALPFPQEYIAIEYVAD